MNKPFSVYIHLPYCLHKCPYCDFNTFAVSQLPENDYVNALLAELDFRTSLFEWKGRPVQTIYFGGGTPSLFSPASLQRIISFLCRRCVVSEDAEISMELNPGTVSSDSLAGYLAAGLNRFSFGAQSFQSHLLKVLGRMHSADDTRVAVAEARDAGCSNLSLDLIFGVPEQSLADITADIETLRQLDPEHVSAYGLTIEKATPFYTSFRSGRLELPAEDLVVEMMDEISSGLAVTGLHRYEISNFAKEGFEAKHNMAYWNGDDYLGLGAGAHSFCSASSAEASIPSTRRWSNFSLPNKYMAEATAHGNAESWSDTLSEKDLMFEFFFLGLRKIQGVCLDDFSVKFGKTVYDVYPTLVKVLSQQGFLTTRENFLSLTEKGLLFADTVIENFVDDDLHDHELPNPSQPVVMNA